MSTLRSHIGRIAERVTTWADPSKLIIHKDRAKKAEVWRTFGETGVAGRSPIYEWDLLAKDVNANVYICTRAIADAIGSLPLEIVAADSEASGESQEVDRDHEANEVLTHPNPQMTMRDIVRHNVKSFLGDGNAYMTIERQTGPNPRIELWPRDPRSVEIILSDYAIGSYRIGKGSRFTVSYPPNRVVHVRDVDVVEPYHGKPRHHALRDEIAMDHWVNAFNSGYFKNGAVLNLMFTPDNELTEAQHRQLLAAFQAELPQGEKKWFQMLINRFPGKFESPGLKHNEIAFLELLKHNREKIFGGFGLPPFRGGVMEYANYANALAQDADFWRNCIMPITSLLADAWNKQLFWRYFGEEIMMRFSFAGVEALRGTPKEQAEIHKIYVDAGIMTRDEVREELGRKPLPESDQPRISPDDRDDEVNPDDDGEDKGAEPTRDDEKALQRVLGHELQQQASATLARFAAFVVNGRLMSRLAFPDQDITSVYKQGEADKAVRTKVIPLYLDAVRSMFYAETQRHRMDCNIGYDNQHVAALQDIGCRLLYDMNDRLRLDVQTVLHDIDKFGLSYQKARIRLRRVFNRHVADVTARHLLSAAGQNIDSVVHALAFGYDHTIVTTEAVHD